MRPGARGLWLLFATLPQVWPAAAGFAVAQDAPPLVLSGQLLVGGEPADSGTVVLHQVSAFFTGEVDSARVDPEGRFRFTLPGSLGGEAAAGGPAEGGGGAGDEAAPGRAGDEAAALLQSAGLPGGEVYFASVRYQGVLYFGGPVTESADTEGSYVIRAYPTVGAREDTPLPLRVRNTFVQRSASGAGWEVTDLFEIENRTQTTIIASEQGPAWWHPLPPEAGGFSVGPSDLNPDAASFRGGRVHTSSAVPPGESVYLFRYTIPGDRFTLPLSPGTRSMELLFREPAGELEVAGLAAVGPVDMEGGTFRRFAGRDLAASLVTVAPASAFDPSGSIPMVAVVLTLALTAAGALLALRGSTAGAGAAPRRHAATDVPAHDAAAPPRHGSAPQDAAARQAVLIEVARLDEERSRGALSDEEHARRRARLIGGLDG